MAGTPKRIAAGLLAVFLLLIQAEAAFAFHTCPLHAVVAAGAHGHGATDDAADGHGAHHAPASHGATDHAGGHAAAHDPAAHHPAAHGPVAHASAGHTHGSHGTAAAVAPAGDHACPACAAAAARADDAAQRQPHGDPCDCMGLCQAGESVAAPAAVVVAALERPATVARAAFADVAVAGPWLPPHFLPFALAPPASV